MNGIRKTIAIVLAVAMVFTSVNVPFGTAFAQGNTTEQPVVNDGAKVEEQADIESIPADDSKTNEAQSDVKNSPVEAPNATTYVAKIGETGYGTLEEAFSNVKPNQTIVLQKDAEGNGIIVKENSDFTVDLNSHKYTITGDKLAGSTGYKSQGFQLLKGSTIVFKNGTLDAGTEAKMLIQNYSNLTLENVNLIGGPQVQYVLSNNCGDVAIKGTTSIQATGNNVAFDVCKFSNYTIPNVTVDTTGTIEGKIEVTGGNLNIINCIHKGALTKTSGTIKVKGGTFSSDVSQYMEPGYKVVSDGGVFKVVVDEAKAEAQIGNAKYVTLKEAVAAAKDGDTVRLINDVVMPNPKIGKGLIPDIIIKKNLTLDLNKHTIKREEAIGNTGITPAFFSIMSGVKVVVTGDGVIDTERKDKGSYGINVFHKDATLVIENGTFYGEPSVVQVQQGRLEIKGGTFDLAKTSKQVCPETAKYIINCVDKYFIDGTAKISVKGGTFVGYNPSDNPEGPGTSYLDKNYTTVTDASGNFKVVVDEAKAEAQIGNVKYATFDDAVAAAKAGEKIELLADANVTKAFKDVTVLARTHKVTFNGLTNVQFDNVVFEGGNLDFKGTKATFNNNTTIMKDLVSLTLDATTNLDVNVANDTKAINVVGTESQATPYAVTIPQGAVLDLHGKELWLAANLDAQDYSKNNYGDGPLRRGTVKGVVQEEHNSEEIKKQTNFFVLMDEGFYRATRKIGPGEGLALPGWNSDPEFLGWYGFDEKLQHNVLMPTTYTFNTHRTYIIPSVYAKKADRKVSENPYAITGVEELNGITVESTEIKNAVNAALQNEGKESFKNAARELVKKMPVQRPDSLYVTADANVSMKATKTGEGYALKPVYVVNTSQKGNASNAVAMGEEKSVVTNVPTTISFKITNVFDGKNIFINGNKITVDAANGTATFTSETGIPAEGLTLTTEIDRVPVDAVIKQIDAIGTVEYTAECKARIDAAQNAYKALTPDQQKLVTNVKVWEKANADYHKLEMDHKAELAKVRDLAQRVIDLGEITLADKPEVESIRTAYEALKPFAQNEFQKYDGVNYLEKLVAAENTIKALEKAEADKAAAQKVIDQIDAIGTVEYTAECKARIDAAQNAYKALTPDQQKLVTNIDVLEKANARYHELEEAAQTVPGKVQNVKVKTDNGLLKVTFGKVAGAEQYKVFIRQVGSKYGFRWYFGNSEGTMVKQLYKKALVKNGKYQIRVAAINKVGRGEFSQIKTVYANRIGTKAANMYAPKIVSVTFNKTKAKVKTAKVIAKKVYVKNTPKKLQYKVSYRLKGTKAWKSAGYSAKNIKFVKGLKKGKTYIFALRYRYMSSLDNKTYVYSKVVYKAAKVR